MELLSESTMRAIERNGHMVWLKSCPRCVNGALTLETEPDAWCVRCLQCGYTKDVEDPIQVALSAMGVEQTPSPARR